MLRQEVLHLKLMLLVIHVGLILQSVCCLTTYQDLLMPIQISAVTVLLLFILHGYTYLSSQKLNVQKDAHLISIIAVVIQTNVLLYLVAVLFLGVETVMLYQQRPRHSVSSRVSQK